MILAVDIGNSHIVLGGAEHGRITFEARLRTERTKTADQYCIAFKSLLELHHVRPGQIEGAIIASVTPPVLSAVQAAIHKLTGVTSLVVGPGLKTGLDIRMENPGQVGADIVAADVAALQSYKPPLIIINMGTATTLSVLDAGGAHIGGCVCPGVKVSLEALTDRASLLPGIQLDRPQRVIGRNTIDAMRSGILLGTASMLDGMVARMEAELGQRATVVATGSIAKFILPLCQTPIRFDGTLVLQGLVALYQANRR